MNTHPHFNFVVQDDQRTITVERTFAAPIDPVWAAWTEADKLCRWWAPRPYRCAIKSLDLRPGGRWLYCMEGPSGDRHWSFFDYDAVRPKSFFSGSDGFCDEQGVINARMPRSRWENHFSPQGNGTLVRAIIQYGTAADLQRILAMGFQEGFSAGLDQLDELLA